MKNGSVLVLGRGASLEHINLVPDVDEFVIANAFSDELAYDKISDKVSDKPVSQIISMGIFNAKHPNGFSFFGAMVADGCYKKFNFQKIIKAYVTECLPNDHNAYQQLYNLRNCNDKIIPVTNMNDIHKPYMISAPRYPYTYPSVGMHSIAYATLELKKKDVHIIGIDFYDDVGYLFDKGVDFETQMRRSKPEAQIMRDWLTGFMAKHQDTNFLIYTKSDYNFLAENVKITRV